MPSINHNVINNQPIASYYPTMYKTVPETSVSWEQLKHNVARPVSMPKDSAPCITPQMSGVKTEAEVQAFNSMTFQWADLDEGDLSRDDVVDMVKSIGVESAIVYSTSYSMRVKDGELQGKKWRVLIQTAHAVDCATWSKLQNAITELLGGDTCVWEPQRVAYLPNNMACVNPLDSEHYEYEILDGKPLDVAELPSILQAAYEVAQATFKQKNASTCVGVVDAEHPFYKAYGGVYGFQGSDETYGKAKASGWVPCICPTQEDHSVDDGRTDIKIGSEGEYHFKCYHQNCRSHDLNGYKMAEQLAALGHPTLVQDIALYNSGFSNMNAQAPVLIDGDSVVVLPQWLTGVAPVAPALDISGEEMDFFDQFVEMTIVKLNKDEFTRMVKESIRSILNVENLILAWRSTYYDTKGGKFAILSQEKDKFSVFSEQTAYRGRKLLPEYVDKEQYNLAIENASQRSGNEVSVIESTKASLYKDCGTAFNAPFWDLVHTYKQHSNLSMRVDLFAERSVLNITPDAVEVVRIHRMFEVTNRPKPSIVKEVVADFRRHFLGFDDLLRMLVASRVSNVRRKAFFDLHAPSGWGKGLLFEDGGVFNKLGIVAEMSVKEIEGAFEGRPSGKDETTFLRSWMLFVDEFSHVTEEIKQLNNSISLSPKNKLSVTVPLYAKVFTHADNVNSLSGETGVESQFGNRFSSIPNNGGDIEDSHVFQRVTPDVYCNALQAYVADYLNSEVKRLRGMGVQEASAWGYRMLDAYHNENRIDKDARMSDSVEDFGLRLRVLIQDAMRGISAIGNNKLVEFIRGHTTVVRNSNDTEVYLVTSVSKLIEMWLERELPRDQYHFMKTKKLEVSAKACMTSRDYSKSHSYGHAGKTKSKGIFIPKLPKFLS